MSDPDAKIVPNAKEADFRESFHVAPRLGALRTELTNGGVATAIQFQGFTTMIGAHAVGTFGVIVMSLPMELLPIDVAAYLALPPHDLRELAEAISRLADKVELHGGSKQ